MSYFFTLFKNFESHLEVCSGCGACLIQEPLQPHPDHLHATLLGVERDGLGAELGQVEGEVVLQVLTDSGQVVNNRYTNMSQLTDHPTIDRPVLFIQYTSHYTLCLGLPNQQCYCLVPDPRLPHRRAATAGES